TIARRVCGLSGGDSRTFVLHVKENFGWRVSYVIFSVLANPAGADDCGGRCLKLRTQGAYSCRAALVHPPQYCYGGRADRARRAAPILEKQKPPGVSTRRFAFSVY